MVALVEKRTLKRSLEDKHWEISQPDIPVLEWADYRTITSLFPLRDSCELINLSGQFLNQGNRRITDRRPFSCYVHLL